MTEVITGVSTEVITHGSGARRHHYETAGSAPLKTGPLTPTAAPPSSRAASEPLRQPRQRQRVEVAQTRQRVLVVAAHRLDHRVLVGRERDDAALPQRRLRAHGDLAAPALLDRREAHRERAQRTIPDQLQDLVARR